GALQRSPNRDPVRGIKGCDHPVVLDIELFLRTRGVLALDDQSRVFPNAVDVALRDQVGLKDVVRSPDDLGAPLTFINGEQRGKRLIFDGDALHRLGENVRVGMSQQDDGLLGMVDNPIGQAWLIVHDQGDAVPAGNVFRGNNDELVPGDFGRETDVCNPSAWNLAAHSGAVEHTGQDYVIDVLRLSGNFISPFLAWDRSTDDGIALRRNFFTSQVRPTGRTIVYDRFLTKLCGTRRALRLRSFYPSPKTKTLTATYAKHGR